MNSKSKTYAEFHYWVDVHDLTQIRGYLTDGTQVRYPEFGFKKDIFDSIIEGLKTNYPDLHLCEHRYF